MHRHPVKNGFVILLSVVLVSVVAFTPQAHGQTYEEQIKEIERNIDVTQKEKDASSERLDALHQSKQKNMQDIKSIDDTIVYTINRLGPLESQINTLSRDVEKSALELRDVEKRVTKSKEMVDNRMRHMYMNGSTSYLDILISSDGLSDMISRISIFKVLVDADQHAMDTYQENLSLAEEKKQEIDGKLDEIKKTAVLMKRMKSVLEGEKVEKTDQTNKINSSITELEEATEEQSEMLASLASQKAQLMEAKKREELEAKRLAELQQASLTNTSTSKLQYPLIKNFPMTSDYGYRVHPITHELNKFHAGIDLGAPQGTAILAAESGVVLVAGKQNGYGNVVIIDHGQGIWTVYGHIMNDGIHVEEGDVVSRGQYIADVGSTGNSTGPHLHFEVRINKEPVDPKDYL